MINAYTNKTRITADQLICAGPCYLFGAIYEVSADAGTMDIYDGQDDVSGVLFHSVTDHSTGMRQLVCFPPVRFDKGLYFDVEGNITEVTVLWRQELNEHVIEAELQTTPGA